MFAAGNGHVDVVAELIHHGADVNARSAVHGACTPLEHAVHSEHVDAARILLEQGARGNLQALVRQEKSDVAGVPLASRDIKDEYRRMIQLLKEHRKRREAQQHGGQISSDGAPSAPPNESSP